MVGQVLDALLDRLAVGHVAGIEHDAADVRVLDAVRPQRLERAPLPLAVPDPELQRLAEVARLEDAPEGRPRRLHVVAVHELEHVVPDGLGRVVAQEVAQRRALVVDRAVVAEHGNEVEAAFREHAEAPLARLERSLRLLVGRHVGDGADHAGDPALPVDEAHLVVEHLAVAAPVGGHERLVLDRGGLPEEGPVARVVKLGDPGVEHVVYGLADPVDTAAPQVVPGAVVDPEAALHVLVVDGVRDRVDQRASEVQLLLERRLGALGLGHVDAHRDEARDPVLVVAKRRRRAVDGDRRAVRAPPVQLQVRQHLPHPRALAKAPGLVLLLLGHEGRAAAQGLVARKPEHALGRGVPERDHAVEVRGVDGHGGSLDDRRQEAVGRHQGPVASALLGEVEEGADHELRLAGGVAHQARAAADPDRLAVAAQQALLGHGRGDAEFAHAGERRVVGREVVRVGHEAAAAAGEVLLGVARELAEGAVHQEVLALQGHEREAHRGLVEGLADEVDLAARPARGRVAPSEELVDRLEDPVHRASGSRPCRAPQPR